MGILKTAGKVAVASSVHGRVQRRQQRRWAGESAAPAPQSIPSPAPPSPPNVNDQLVQLTQLGQLRDAGVLTEAEFELKKAQILGR